MPTAFSCYDAISNRLLKLFFENEFGLSSFFAFILVLFSGMGE